MGLSAGSRGHCPQPHCSPGRQNWLSKPMRQCVLSGSWPPEESTTKERGGDRDYWRGRPNDKHIRLSFYMESCPLRGPCGFPSVFQRAKPGAYSGDKGPPLPGPQSSGHCPTCAPTIPCTRLLCLGRGRAGPSQRARAALSSGSSAQKTHPLSDQEPGTVLKASCKLFPLILTNSHKAMDLTPVFKMRKPRLGECPLSASPCRLPG